MKPAAIHGVFRLFRRIHIRKDNAGNTVIKQHRHVWIINAAHTHQRGDANGKRRLRNGENAFQVEDGVLHVNEQKVVACAACKPRRIGAADYPQRQPKYCLARLHLGLERVKGVL